MRVSKGLLQKYMGTKLTKTGVYYSNYNKKRPFCRLLPAPLEDVSAQLIFLMLFVFHFFFFSLIFQFDFNQSISRTLCMSLGLHFCQWCRTPSLIWSKRTALEINYN